MLRKIDPLGRIVIPKEWRDELALEPGAIVDINKTGNKIIFEKYKEACIVCGKEATLTIKNQRFCNRCLKEIKKF